MAFRRPNVCKLRCKINIVKGTGPARVETHVPPNVNNRISWRTLEAEGESNPVAGPPERPFDSFRYTTVKECYTAERNDIDGIVSSCRFALSGLKIPRNRVP